MVGTKCYFLYRQQPRVKRLGFGIASLFFVQKSTRGSAFFTMTFDNGNQIITVNVLRHLDTQRVNCAPR